MSAIREGKIGPIAPHRYYKYFPAHVSGFTRACVVFLCKTPFPPAPLKHITSAVALQLGSDLNAGLWG